MRPRCHSLAVIEYSHTCDRSTGKDHVCRVVMKEATDGAPPWVCGFKTNTYEDTRHHRYKNHGIGSQPLPEGELCAIIPWQSRRREPAQPPPVSQRGVDAAEPRAQIDSSRGGNHVFALSGPSPPSPEGYRSYRFDVEELSTFGPPPVVELGSMLSSTVQSRARAPPEHPPTTAKVTPSAFSFSSWIRTLGPDQPADSGGYLSAGKYTFDTALVNRLPYCYCVKVAPVLAWKMLQVGERRQSAARRRLISWKISTPPSRRRRTILPSC